jgi:ferrous iron transport protein B
MEKSLNSFVMGESGIIVSVKGEGKIRRRLLDMGITPGAEVYLRKKAPLGDPLEITLRGYELTLRKDEASYIYLESEGDEGGKTMKRFALAGNPNSGKTTLFNSLTGSSEYVGNWPGVTVEKKMGTYKNKKTGATASVVDLPGIYSLSPYTPEEVVSRNYILEEKPDCVINIVDATNLERNLYLTTQSSRWTSPSSSPST